jgi:predicted component of type VI protein secretion system
MRLAVKRAGQTVKEFRFVKGPVFIGRHVHSQVFLPDRAVSRQHAAIFATRDGRWMVEDLDSSNGTFLNGKVVRKAEIKSGDGLRIGDFAIEINIEGEADAGEAIHLDDTLIQDSHKPAAASTESAGEIIVRKPDVEHAPDIRLPAKRARDFLQATETICKANGPDEVLAALLSVTSRHFSAYRSWCALRNQPEGPMTCHAGKSRDGRAVELAEIEVKEKVTQAVERKEFLLIPQVSSPADAEKIRSAMIAPIIDPAGCFGVLYVDNAMDDERYSLSDLDYLMLLAIHTAAIVENF